jgi:hypothetical protein
MGFDGVADVATFDNITRMVMSISRHGVEGHAAGTVVRKAAQVLGKTYKYLKRPLTIMFPEIAPIVRGFD